VIWYNVGEAYMQMHQYADAEPYLNRATTIQPDFVDGYVLKAQLAIHRDGDVAAARSALQNAAERVPPSQWRPAQRGLWLFGFSRIVFDTPEAALGRMRPGVYGLDTSAYYAARAELAGRTGQLAAARAYHDSARVVLERRRDVYPENASIHGELGIAYAGLGRAAEAVAEARQAVDLLPIAKDALDGPDWVVNLARVYLMTGDRRAAIQQLEIALSLPSRVSRNWLRLDPLWTPLHSEPPFQRLIERSAAAN
jgi:serine/threonine-protein kinase